MRAVVKDENRALAENRAIRTITIWPALILAARRNDSVIGRTENLDDSTITRNGFNQGGAPPGSSLAVNFIGCERIDDRIMLSQSVRPKENVNSRCLERLKIYGVSLIRLIVIRKRKSVEMIAFQPRNFCAYERVSWLKIVLRSSIMVHMV